MPVEGKGRVALREDFAAESSRVLMTDPAN